MPPENFTPCEGGVKIVVDVPDGEVDQALHALTVGGFQTRRYHPVGHRPRAGGAAPGNTRLGAERPRRTFTDDEKADVVATFEAVLAVARLDATVVGVDVWAAGNGGGPAGVREPRPPRPRPVTGASAMVESSQSAT